MRELETVKVPVGEIREHPRNPRKGNVTAIVESIQANGLYRPVIVQKSTRYILAGNHTFKALKELGETLIPVVFVDVDDNTATRILLADNRTADLGEYDNETLAELLGSLGEEIQGTGYNEYWENELAELTDELNQQDDNYYTQKVTSPVYEPKMDVPPRG